MKKEIKTYQNIAVFCGASGAISSMYHAPMRRVGELLAEKGITLVFGIGDEGLMGSAFQGARNKGGRVLGITTKELLDLQCKDKSVFKKDELFLTDTLSQRKRAMFDASDAILIGPGGWGTLDELAEFAVLIQIGEIPKRPMIFLNFCDFWAPFKTLILNMLQDGILAKNKVDFIDFVDRPEEVFAVLEKVQVRLDPKSFK